MTRVLSDLGRVEVGVALKVPLKQLTGSIPKVRAALNRASRRAGRRVATASDGNFLYHLERDASSGIAKIVRTPLRWKRIIRSPDSGS